MIASKGEEPEFDDGGGGQAFSSVQVFTFGFFHSCARTSGSLLTDISPLPVATATTFPAVAPDWHDPPNQYLAVVD